MINIHLIKNYIFYQFKAKTAFDIHSPFVFSLINNVFDRSIAFYHFELIEAHRNRFLLQNETIEVKDLGAGSKINKQQKRIIKNIAKSSLAPKKYTELLFKLANFLDAKNKIEVGTSLGITSVYLAFQNTKTPLYTLEGAIEIHRIANQLFSSLKLSNIHSILGNFNDTLIKVLSKQEEFDFIYIDGNHTYEATTKYFEMCLPKLSENGVIIIDDIYWSKQMTKAWNDIKLNKETTITIDIFKMGLVFKNKSYTKQDFVIKY